tara:strand:+ start:2928 stop:5153 length:2226 start_codon:yes stop_codon:yes gene_type:complete
MKVGYRKNKFSEFPIVKGRERVLLIGADERRTSLFAIVELDSIIASHNEKSFGTSKDYPLDDKGNNVNDRNYANDKNAQAKVKSVAQNLEPNMIISTSVNPSGTPIISIDGIVVSGNNRVMSLKLAKSDYPKKYKEYLSALTKEINYGGYGINYAQIFGDFNNPVLVRIDKDFKEYNSAELNKYNVVREKSEKAIDKSVRISKLLQNNEGCKNKLIDLINEQEVVSELYKNISSVARFKSILLECELINENDISALFSKGTLSEQGKLIYRTILLSLVLNEDSLEISQSDGIKVFTKNVVNAILPLIKNKSLSKGSLIGFVNDSFLIQNDLVNGGFKHLNDYVKQSKLGFEEVKTDYKNKKALIINEVVNSGFSKLKNTLIRYNNSMEKNIEPDMFGEQLGEQEIFYKTFGVELDEKTLNLISKMGMKQQPKEKHSTNSKLDMLYRVLNSKYENQGMSLKEIYDEVIYMQGVKDGALIFSDFAYRKRQEGDKRFTDEFNKTSFVENIQSKETFEGKPKISKKFDNVSLYYKGVYYFPNDIIKSDKRENKPFQIQGVYYNKSRQKWMQDTFYISKDFKEFLLDNYKQKPKPSSEKQQLEESFKQRIKVGNRYGDWTVTIYKPISYDDLGGVNDGYLKLVNQDNFELIEILNDNALRRNSWFSESLKGLQIEDVTLKNALKKSILAYQKTKPSSEKKEPKETEKQKSIQAKIRIYERLLTKAKGENKNIIESKIRIYNKLLKN